MLHMRFNNMINKKAKYKAGDEISCFKSSKYMQHMFVHDLKRRIHGYTCLCMFNNLEKYFIKE